jgi:predicted transcriptional regulator
MLVVFYNVIVAQMVLTEMAKRVFMTREQCRMARAGLHLSQVELARRAGVAAATIAEFEKGRRTPYDRTVRDIQQALEEAGIKFVNGGVALEAEGRP